MISKLKKIKSNSKYFFWRLFHPKGSFHEYYVERVSERVDRDQPHETLGNVKKNEKKFHDSAKYYMDFLKQHGMNNGSRVVDYGCGSLRLGRYLVDYLEKGLYWGVDVTEKFYNMGLTEIDQKNISEKKPRLDVIEEAILAEIKSWKPDFFISTAVLYHVPPKEINLFVQNVVSSLSENSIALVDFVDSPEAKKIGVMTWSYPKGYLVKLFEKCGAKCEIVEVENKKNVSKHEEYKFLKITL